MACRQSPHPLFVPTETESATRSGPVAVTNMADAGRNQVCFRFRLRGAIHFLLLQETLFLSFDSLWYLFTVSQAPDPGPETLDAKRLLLHCKCICNAWLI